MRAIVTFLGFTESAQAPSGTETVYMNEIRPLAGKDMITYEPRTWKTNVENLAQQLQRLGVKNVAIVSYSHGQSAAISLAKLSWEYGFHVDLWLACDPVYRPSWASRSIFGQLFSVRALIPGSAKIRVPESISRVVWCRQRKTIPCGHDLVADVPESTEIEPPQWVKCGHLEIDIHPIWSSLVREELSKWVKAKKQNL